MGLGSSKESDHDSLPAIVSPPIVAPEHPDEPVAVRPVVINVTCLDARNIPPNADGSYDPQVLIEMTAEGFSKQSATTKTRTNSSPIWRQGFNFSCHPKSVDDAKIYISLHANGGEKELGSMVKSVKDIAEVEYIDQRFPFGSEDCTTRIVFEVADWGESGHHGHNLHIRRKSTQADTQPAQVEGFTGTGAADGFSKVATRTA